MERTKQKIGMWAAIRRFFSALFNMGGTISEGVSNSVEDLSKVANLETNSLVQEAEYRNQRVTILTGVKTKVLKQKSEEAEFLKKLEDKTEEEILEYFDV